MKRFVRRLRRSTRWPEETHMLIAGVITIAAIFALVFGAAKYGGPTTAPIATARPAQ